MHFSYTIYLYYLFSFILPAPKFDYSKALLTAMNTVLTLFIVLRLFLLTSSECQFFKMFFKETIMFKNKNAIQRIESGQRFVTDIELVALAKVLKVSLNELLH